LSQKTLLYGLRCTRESLTKTKPVIICGDLNVAHQAIDLARPKENYNKAAGYMQEEIDGLSRFVKAGLVDTFRNANPDLAKYSWWSYRAGAREKNVGWRIDYFLASQSFLNRISATEIRAERSTPSSCDGVECKFAFPDGGAPSGASV
jgi:exodeoxyribonuclease-3